MDADEREWEEWMGNQIDSPGLKPECLHLAWKLSQYITSI
jgi:hypothetical protein